MYKRIVSKGNLPHGYMKVQLEFEDPEVKEEQEISVSKFKFMMVAAMKSLYGELGSTDKIDILRFDETKLQAILRVPHAYFVKLWTSLTLYGEYCGKHCAFRILQVSAHLMGLASNSREFNFDGEEEVMDT